MHPHEVVGLGIGVTSKAPTLKGIKRDILDTLGFLNDDWDEIKNNFESVGNTTGNAIYNFADGQIKDGRRVTIRRLDRLKQTNDKGSRGTGFPVSKIRTQDDLAATFDVDDSEQVKSIVMSGGKYVFSEDSHEVYEVFSVPFSERVSLYPEGANKNDDALGESILCGGGLRLQLNSTLPGGGYVVDLDIILQDRDPRDLETNKTDPSFTKRYFLDLDQDGKLSVRNATRRNLFVNGKYYGSEIIDRLMLLLVANNGASLDLLFDTMMTLFPSHDLHSIEALFGIQSGELKAKVIDVDGFDTVWSWNNQNRLQNSTSVAPVGSTIPQNYISAANERLAHAHHVIVQQKKFNKMGENMFANIRLQLTKQLTGNTDWESTVSAIIKKVRDNCLYQNGWYAKGNEGWELVPMFSSSLSEEHKLAIFCRNINLWQPDETQDISIHTSTIGDGGLRMITIDMFGYGMSFIVENNELKDLSEYGQPHAVYKKVAALTHNQFVPILVNQFHEGD